VGGFFCFLLRRVIADKAYELPPRGVSEKETIMTTKELDAAEAKAIYLSNFKNLMSGLAAYKLGWSVEKAKRSGAS
jgi:hypothetical protein